MVEKFELSAGCRRNFFTFLAAREYLSSKKVIFLIIPQICLVKKLEISLEKFFLAKFQDFQRTFGVSF